MPNTLTRQKSKLGSELRKNDVQYAKQYINGIVENCKIAQTKFVDDSFPPNKRSLYFNGVEPIKSSIQYRNQSETEKVHQWLRPGEFEESDKCNLPWTVFRNPKGSDIVQGVLGNCWLLSALAVLAEKPAFLKQLFPVDEYCATGVYEVRLCREGTWMLVTVDDMLPCTRRGRLLYSDCMRRQLWVPIVEKACAKLYGCYEALVAGRCVEGLSLLTGAPCETINLQRTRYEDDPDHELVWGQLISAMQAGHIMGASCGGGQMQVDAKFYDDFGLKPRHAYSVMDVRLVNGYRLIRLRNPWGKFSWKGAWSDSSPQVAKNSMKSVLKAYGASEGIFWMEYQDFVQFFDSVDLCRLNHDWVLTRIEGYLPGVACTGQHMGIITVFKPTEVVITLFQKNNRERNMIRCLDLCIVVCRCNDQTFSPIKLITHSKRQLKSFVTCSHVFEPGVYLILPMAFNHYNGEQRIPSKEEIKAKMPAFTITCHSMSSVTVDRFFLGKHTLADCLWLTAHDRGISQQVREGVTVYYLSGGWSGLIVAVENRYPDSYLKVKCDCDDSFNVVATRGSLLTMDVIPPLHRQVIVILSQLEVSGGHKINHKLSHRISSKKDLEEWASKGVTHLPPLTPGLLGLHEARPL